MRSSTCIIFPFPDDGCFTGETKYLALENLLYIRLLLLLMILSLPLHIYVTTDISHLKFILSYVIL